ncbi:excisionase family DNA-binding protein [Mycobacteroides abscessus]|uniref:excisionase family DNA-binding protein n=1 Tax=Mycobacteroides abscessus TaxID=36809 RepID=UPI0005DDAD7A|nr:helix-turn-helix domain-containing protein [Mycobacteroides abscessus]CPZ76706.1 DNA binding domain%2C excisionase family [Mycobacteroides abscessus]
MNEMLSTHDAAQILGVTHYAVAAEIRAGRLQATREGHAYRITREDLDSYVAYRERRRVDRRATARARVRAEEDAIRAEGFLTMEEAVEQLGVVRLTVDAMVADGRLKAVRRGGRWVTTAEWVDAAPRGRKRYPRRVPEGTLSVAEASQQSGLSADTLLRAIRDGRLPATPPTSWPNGYGIDPRDLEQFTAAEWAKPVSGFRRMAARAAEWRKANGYLSTPEAAAVMGMSPLALTKRIADGRVPAVRAPEGSPRPGAWLIRREDVVRDAA